MHDRQTTNTHPDLTDDDAGGHWLLRSVLILVLVVFGFFYMMLAMGGASFIHECGTLVCGQLHQAVFAAIGALALFVGAYRVFEGKPWAEIVFLGSLPILVVHVLLVITDPDEAVFFPLSTTPPPLISGAVLLTRAMTRKRNTAERL